MSEATLRVFLDASALIKRYSPEPGSDVIDDLFNLIPIGRMACSTLGMLEVTSILLRQYNGSRLQRPAFEQAMAEFEMEVASNAQFVKTSVDDALLKAGIPFLAKHNLNASDTIILLSAINLQRSLQQKGEGMILCAADKRLVRAATAEGLIVLNPEVDSIARLHQLLAFPH